MQYNSYIKYDNEQWYREILLVYERMVAIFTENYWLVDQETQQYYPELCRFVEIWHRYKAKAIPRDVLLELEHSEDRLQPLYSPLVLSISSTQTLIIVTMTRFMVIICTRRAGLNSSLMA